MKLNLNKWSRGRKKERARATRFESDLICLPGTPPPAPAPL